MSRCAHIDREQLEGGCYSCCKSAAGLLRDLPANGQGPPTAAQLRWVGVEDEATTGRWDYTSRYVDVPIPDLLSQLLATEPVHPWDRTVPLT